MTNTEEKESRNWGMFCHLSALSLWIGVPFGNIIGPLIIWLVKKDELPFVDQQGKEALNFQISMTIYLVVSVILIFVGIGILLLIGLLIAHIVLVIVASVKISGGEDYKYPFTIRFMA